MRRFILLGPVLLAGFACSGGDVPGVERPTAAEVQTFYGLHPGTCFRYRIPAKQTFGRIEVTGPNTQSIAGRTVFDQELFLDTAERPYRWQFELAGDAELRLLRWIEGSGSQQLTKRYEAVASPLFMQLEYDREDNVDVERGARFEVDTMPEVCGQGSCDNPQPMERHSWLVLEEPKTVPTPDGEMEAIQLQYRLTVDAETKTARYELVPGRGVASFTDFEGTIHSICAWKTCNADGSCTVDTPCNELTCI